jgi:hypothetical protein
VLRTLAAWRPSLTLDCLRCAVTRTGRAISPVQPEIVMNTSSLTAEPAARLVPEHERLNFLPKHFGKKLMLHGEALVYGWMSRLASEYKGGLWNFYEIEGGFYMAPTRYERLRVMQPGNGFDHALSADAAGIVVTLYAINELCWSHPCEFFDGQYYALRDFAKTHVEAALIFGAID